MEHLPLDIYDVLITYLHHKEIRTLSCVSRTLNSCVNNEDRWYILCKKVWLVENKADENETWKECYRRTWEKYGRYEDVYCGIKQSWDTIYNVLRLHGCDRVFNCLRKGLSNSEIDDAEKILGYELPDDYKCSLRLYDGQLLTDIGIFGSVEIACYVDSEALLSLEMCVAIKERGKLDHCLPITYCLGQAGGQFMLLKDIDNAKKGETFWVTETNNFPQKFHRFSTGKSFGDLLAKHASVLQSEQFVVDDINKDFMPFDHDKESVAVTNGIKVSVSSRFIANESSILPPRFIFTYHVTISMDKDIDESETCKLQSRYWKITDGEGEVEEVYGQGVVGKYPVMHPGAVYKYFSFTEFYTPEGFMEGYYDFHFTKRHDVIRVTIPRFHMKALPHFSFNPNLTEE